MAMVEKLRIDKYLWAIRMFKTRSLATEACKSGRVKMSSQSVKSSHEVKVNEIYSFNRGSEKKIIQVKELLSGRVDASKAILYYEDLSPAPDMNPVGSSFYSFGGKRDRGTGRPTKKERRDIDDLGVE